MDKAPQKCSLCKKGFVRRWKGRKRSRTLGQPHVWECYSKFYYKASITMKSDIICESCYKKLQRKVLKGEVHDYGDDDNSMVGEGGAAGVKVEEDDTSSLSSVKEEPHNFAIGDNVEVCDGKLQHLQGTILEIDGNEVTVMPKVINCDEDDGGIFIMIIGN